MIYLPHYICAENNKTSICIWSIPFVLVQNTGQSGALESDATQYNIIDR